MSSIVKPVTGRPSMWLLRKVIRTRKSPASASGAYTSLVLSSHTSVPPSSGVSHAW